MEEVTLVAGRVFADAALDFITDDDDGSDEFHLICGIQHRFTTRDDPSEDQLVRSALAVAIGLLHRRADDPAIGARLCLEKLARLVGLSDRDMLDSLASCIGERWDLWRLSLVLLDGAG